MKVDEISNKSTTSSYEETVVNSFIFPEDGRTTHKTILYQEMRLVERNENEINVCWKGAHMMLFFMSFVFGSLCTCCIHKLKFMFGEKCVLYPKIVTYSTIQRMAYEFFSFKAERTITDFDVDTPVEFVTTKWSENSVCYLPTYMPLVSGLAGLVWTTMFLMCSSGTSHNVTGAQRHWRALPIMFLFSATMSCLCIYASTITHNGLRDLCSKLAEATGSTKCGYTINVATLAYERRINGVYQATLLSIASAWLHTICWLLSTLLIVARVLLAVDFTLVHVKAQLIGNMDDIMQKYEKQINSLNAEAAKPYKSDIDEEDSEVELYTTTNTANETRPQLPYDSKLDELNKLKRSYFSTISLVPEERKRLYVQDIQEILNDLFKYIFETKEPERLDTKSPDIAKKSFLGAENNERLTEEIRQKLHERLTQEINEFNRQIELNLKNKDVNPDQTIKSNVTDELEYDKIKHGKPTISSQKKGNKNEIMPLKRSPNVQFSEEGSSNDLTEEGNSRKKYEGNEQNKSEDKNIEVEKSSRRGGERVLDDSNISSASDRLALENKTKTKGHKEDEQKNNDNGQNKSADKPQSSGLLRILDDLIDLDRSASESKTTTKGHKEDDHKDNDNGQNKSADEPHSSGFLRMLDDFIDQDRSASENKTATKDQILDSQKDNENEQNKSENKVKPHSSGFLQMLDDLTDHDRSASENKKTTEDQKQDEGNEYIQNKSEEKVKPYSGGETDELKIIYDSKIDKRSALENKKTTKDKKQDEQKNNENKDNRSEEINTPHSSDKSAPENIKTTKDQKKDEKEDKEG